MPQGSQKISGKKQGPIRVNEGNLEKYLGKERVSFEDANEEDEVGIVRGLAWTSVGGDTLQIEVNVMPGKGNLLMTGQMGDVMKESAQIALTYVRSICPDYQVADDYFENMICICIFRRVQFQRMARLQVLPWQQLCFLL